MAEAGACPEHPEAAAKGALVGCFATCAAKAALLHFRRGFRAPAPSAWAILPQGPWPTVRRLDLRQRLAALDRPDWSLAPLDPSAGDFAPRHPRPAFSRWSGIGAPSRPDSRCCTAAIAKIANTDSKIPPRRNPTIASRRIRIAAMR